MSGFVECNCLPGRKCTCRSYDPPSADDPPMPPMCGRDCTCSPGKCVLQPAVDALARQHDRARNPWGLTDREAEVMDAMCETGSAKLAARRLGLSPSTIGNTCHKVARKMGDASGSRFAKFLHWDRWRRAPKEPDA